MGKKRFFVDDFYCAEKKIIIEIDGKIHENQVDYDSLRDHLINEMGIRVVRIKNEDLADIPALIEKLKPDFL
jgi:very-short-patch-repair endonuclease